MSNYNQHSNQSNLNQSCPSPFLAEVPESSRHNESHQSPRSRLRRFFRNVKDRENLSSTRSAGPGPKATREKDLRQVAANKAREQQREVTKERAKEYKEEKEARLADEKARKQWLGGVAWGFDPTAGMRSSGETNEADGGYYVSAGRSLRGLEEVDEIDDLGRRTGRHWVSHSLWGVEYGGPGKEGKYGHGSLRNGDEAPPKPGWEKAQQFKSMATNEWNLRERSS